ncbi:MAG: hypothetical protein ABH862_02510 [Candidatus Omnitrophota bacterium]
MERKNNKKAIVMLSGGLDSSLALKMINDQGIEVLALHFTSSFCKCDGAGACGSTAKKVSDLVGSELKIIRLGQEYLDLIKAPKHGYGKNMNPCIDCRILKFKYGRKIMEEVGASFIVTGEVLGQRPMSQHKRAMMTIEKESDLEGLIVRPLSAKVLEPSIPEKENWVSRDLFLDLQGRNRTPQIKLAEELGINDYPCPAGGCLLTDPGFARRLKDLIEHGTLDTNNAELLKIGRHIKITPEFKFVVGRNEKENDILKALAQEDDIILEAKEDISGPTCIGRGKASEKDIEIAAQITARYITLEQDEIDIAVQKGKNAEKYYIRAYKMKDEDIKKMMLV